LNSLSNRLDKIEKMIESYQPPFDFQSMAEWMFSEIERRVPLVSKEEYEAEFYPDPDPETEAMPEPERDDAAAEALLEFVRRWTPKVKPEDMTAAIDKAADIKWRAQYQADGSIRWAGLPPDAAGIYFEHNKFKVEV